MSTDATIDNSILHIAPDFSIEGAIRIVELRELSGFGEREDTKGEPLKRVYLPSLPIATRVNEHQFTIINHEHPEIEAGLSGLSPDATLWVFVIANCSPEVREKIRLFQIVSAVRDAKNRGNKLTKKLLKDIGRRPDYQKWLTDHSGLKCTGNTRRSPVNIKSLCTLLGMPNHASVSARVQEGWEQHLLEQKAATQSHDDAPEDPDAYEERRIVDPLDDLVRPKEAADPELPSPADDSRQKAGRIWDAFSAEEEAADFDTWYQYLQALNDPTYAPHFINRIQKTKGNHEALAHLHKKMIEKVGQPHDG